MQKQLSLFSNEPINVSNSFGELCPSLLKEWDYERNKYLSPYSFGCGSSKKVWWKCPNGHSYFSNISNRARRKDK